MFTQPVGMKERFYLFKDKSNEFGIIGEELMAKNGHCTYVPGTNNEWILNDSYPETNERLQNLYLYHVPTNRKILLGKFHSPPVYNHPEWRCDLHPWSSRDGKKVFFESTHEGKGRRVYMIDISGIIGNK